jgi:hypothetical protein
MEAINHEELASVAGGIGPILVCRGEDLCFWIFF